MNSIHLIQRNVNQKNITLLWCIHIVLNCGMQYAHCVTVQDDFRQPWALLS